jgi:hypothetical protein
MSRIFEFLEKWEIPKVRVFFHLLLSVLTAGVWILIAVLIEIYIISSRENKVWEANRKRLEAITKLKWDIKNRRETIDEILKVKAQLQESLASSFEKPFELPTVWLWESREKVTAVTSGTTLGKTRTGTVGLGWSDGIGWAASQGVERGTIASHTTEIISNEFMELDSGILRIGKEFVAFIGNQFSRTGHYRDILAINSDYENGIGLSIVNSEKIWLTRFPAEFEKNIALTLIQSAYTKTIKSQDIQLDDLLKEFDSSISAIQQEIADIEKDLLVLANDPDELKPL